MVYLKSVENVITLGKLIGLLFLFCLPLLSILFLKTKRYDLARPVMGTIFLVRERAKRVRHPLLLPIEKMFGRKYVKTTMRMLTILREAEEWTRVHL